MDDLPELGVGLMYFAGLEPALSVAREAGIGVDLVEVEPQPLSTWVRGQLRLRPERAAALRALPQEKLVHSVGAPVAGTLHEPRMLRPAVEAVAQFRAPWASEHLSLDRLPDADGGHFASFMLPALQSEQTVKVAAERIKALRRRLGVPVAVETPVNYLRPVPGEMTDGHFYAAVAEEADCGLLVDVHNLWCNERNGRQPVLDVLDELSTDRVWEIHLAGGRELDGYRVDAHSGLVEEPVWRLAEEVVRRLPNLRAIVFEVMPEYLTEGGVDAVAIAGQLQRMRTLWEQRGKKLRAPSGRTLRPAGRVHGGLPDPRTWERALDACLKGRPATDRLTRLLANDPGIGIYRKLIASVRMGIVVDVLRFTYRLLALNLGARETQQLLGRYLAEVPGHPVAEEEARGFVRWLTDNALPIPSLDEVAEFELATIEVRRDGTARTVKFTRSPLPLLEALGAGRLPEPGESGDYELEVTP